MQDYIERGWTAAQLKAVWQLEGVHRMPSWTRLPYWDWALDMLLDYMHMCKNNCHRCRLMMAQADPNPDQTKKAIREISPTPKMAWVTPELRMHTTYTCLLHSIEGTFGFIRTVRNRTRS